MPQTSGTVLYNVWLDQGLVYGPIPSSEFSLRDGDDVKFLVVSI